MKISYYISLLVIAILCLGCCTKDNIKQAEKAFITYYVDANTGNDNNSGTSPDQAFATLEKVNTLSLKEGTHVLFKSGTSYAGQLKPKGGGVSGNPIIISKYGGEARPVINGEGRYIAAVHFYNMAYIELRDLEITNTGAEQQNGRRGVVIEAENCGKTKHIILDNLFIHDVNGSLVKSKGGGSAILWRNHGDKSITTFDSLIIQNCHLKDCTRNGINARGYTKRDNWHPSTNVIIRNNLLEGIPGDGIVPIGTDGALIEYNVMRDCPDILSHAEAAAGIWPWSADNTLIQFNEVSGHKAKWDGQGFDSDWNCLNTTIQYNYSHDNYGGFLLICNKGNTINTPSNIGTKNTIVRYNVSVNDGIRPYPTERRGWFSPCMHISGPVENNFIHHNLFIFPEKANVDIDRTFIQMDNWGGPWANKTLVANNSLEFSEPYKMFYGKSKQTCGINNEFDSKMLGLTREEQVPVWAKDYLNDYDTEWKEKMIEAFFKDDDEMKNILIDN
ncbi:right-handed parallel beta-helix repeat-containing protein [Carboxylicivirga sediminis]|uniref:Right-handed parallel beta-helix repeat-containing protein n=1 Tax=Carboxylicivirga sediminis TaxID=2006564 RepID=A0A941F6I7_9BACT|nr:right-handed parallel beta-helix repeat-containing protein [Carboxylicivirga sediminis]MBR8536150.1 right-handed parallel beta-helix repeat-containing protein [Carboxylicivirga sediminis]